MDIGTARQFYYAPDMMTEIAILVDDYEKVAEVEAELEHAYGDIYNYLTWKELSPELVQFINSDKGSGIIMQAILYLVIGFGILGTIMMMMAERRREMGVMVAVGMQKFRLSKVIWLETLMIGFVGVLIGFIVSIPLIAYLTINPIPITGEYAEAYAQFGMEPVIYFKMASKVFIEQMIIVFLITLAISAYPYRVVRKLNAIEAIRG